jgi:hypothetical protein
LTGSEALGELSPEKADAETERIEGDYFRGILLAFIVLAYFAGFVVRYDFLNRLGLSIASTTLPVYYLCVYSYDVIVSQPWVLVVLLGVAAVVAFTCWQVRGRPKRREAVVVACVYPGLMTAFFLAFPLLARAAQLTADGQVLDLYLPRHELGTRLVLAKQFLEDHCGSAGARAFIDASPAEVKSRKFRANPLHERCRDVDVGALLEASENARLILIAESPQDVIFFERPANAAPDVFPATRVYRIKKSDAALASTRIGP